MCAIGPRHTKNHKWIDSLDRQHPKLFFSLFVSPNSSLPSLGWE